MTSPELRVCATCRSCREKDAEWVCKGRYDDHYEIDRNSFGFRLWEGDRRTWGGASAKDGSYGFAKGEFDKINKNKSGKHGEEVYQNRDGLLYSKGTARAAIEAKKAQRKPTIKK